MCFWLLGLVGLRGSAGSDLDRSSCHFSFWGCPKIRGTFWGGPYKGLSYFRVNSGVPFIFGKYHLTLRTCSLLLLIMPAASMKPGVLVGNLCGTLGCIRLSPIIVEGTLVIRFEV